jgi:subtilase family serine protease
VIIDAFQDPTLGKDLAAYDSTFKLPPPPSFEIVAPFGITPFDSSNENQVGWSGEIALDVEWAHAIAPAAKLVLALSPSDSAADTLATQRYVIKQNLGDVVSMSFAETEECDPVAEEEHALFKQAVNRGITLVAGAGDLGASSFNCTFTGFLTHRAVALPASDPNVTAVGGTNLIASLSTGRYESESVWNEPQESAAGGGGFSSLYPAPNYQTGVSAISSQRGVPDVAYSASFRRGVIVAWGSSSEPSFEFWNFGGTSAGTPQWAALAAIADQVAQRRLGNINPALYTLGKSHAAANTYHDITVGNNDFPPVTGYAATPGWDPASGWGSPIASSLVEALASGTSPSGDQSKPTTRQPGGTTNTQLARSRTFKPLGR